MLAALDAAAERRHPPRADARGASTAAPSGVDAYVRPTGGGRSERDLRALAGRLRRRRAARCATRLQIPFEGRTAPAALGRRRRARRPPAAQGAAPALRRPTPRARWSRCRCRPAATAGSGCCIRARTPPRTSSPAARPARGRRRGSTASTPRSSARSSTRSTRAWPRAGAAGRVLLAGDAAHLMPPFAGQGFSSRRARRGQPRVEARRRPRAARPTRCWTPTSSERRPHVAGMQRLAGCIGGFVQSTTPRRGRVRDDGILNAIDGTRSQRLLAENVKPLPTYGAGAFAASARRGCRGAAPSARCSPRPSASTTGSGRAGRRWRVDEPLAARCCGRTASAVVDPGADDAWLDAPRPDVGAAAAGPVRVRLRRRRRRPRRRARLAADRTAPARIEVAA